MGMACTVLPLLLTAHLLPRRFSLPRWLPTSSVMEPSAPEAAAPMLDGTAALMACTAQPPPLTAHLWRRRPRLPRWPLTSSVMEPSAPGAFEHFIVELFLVIFQRSLRKQYLR